MDQLQKTSLASYIKSIIFPRCHDLAYEKEVCRELAEIVNRDLDMVKKYVKAKTRAKRKI